MDGGLAHERSPPPAPRLAVGRAGLHSVAGSMPRCRRRSLSFMSASRTARPLQPGHRDRGWCLAVDRQDRLEPSPLIPAVGSGAGRSCFGVARGCPLGTDHDRCAWHGSGTARGQPWYACRCWVHLDHRVRAVRGDHGCMGKPLQTARQLFPMPSGRGRMGRWLRRPASMPAELGSSRPGSKGGSTCRFSRRPRLGTLSRHLYCGHFDARRGTESANLHSRDTAGRCHIQLLPIRT
jgi:hypothetical protein